MQELKTKCQFCPKELLSRHGTKKTCFDCRQIRNRKNSLNRYYQKKNDAKATHN